MTKPKESDQPGNYWIIANVKGLGDCALRVPFPADEPKLPEVVVASHIFVLGISMHPEKKQVALTIDDMMLKQQGCIMAKAPQRINRESFNHWSEAALSFSEALEKYFIESTTNLKIAQANDAIPVDHKGRMRPRM